MRLNILLSCSGAYLDYALITVASVIMSKAPETDIDFFLFCSDFTGEREQQVQQFRAGFPDGCTLRLLNINAELQRRGLPFSLPEGQETAGNLLAAELLPQAERVLALDSDLIVRQDLSDLFWTPMEPALIAGVKDFDFIGQYHCGNQQHRRYYQKTLGLKEPYSYLQGGVVLMDLARFRMVFQPGELFSRYTQEKYRYDEQDFLNLACEGKKVLVDPRWNVLHDNDRYRVRYVISLGPESCVREYAASRTEPWIIHYAGEDKPWKNRQCDFSEEFWRVAKDCRQFFHPPDFIEQPNRPLVKSLLKRARNELLRAYRIEILRRSKHECAECGISGGKMPDRR